MVRALADFSDLHVYAPDQENGALGQWDVDGVTYYAGSPVRRTQLSRIGTYPYAGRGSWSRHSTREALSIAERLRPDIIHSEYNQTAEALLRARVNRLTAMSRTTITLHDLSWGGVFGPPPPGSNPVRRWLHDLERVKSRHTRNAIEKHVDAIFVYSERDRAKIPDASGIVEVVPVGVARPAQGWLGDRRHTAAFGGALWRSENEAAAEYLALEVMPLVRERLPDATLRIFGARPTNRVTALGSEAGVTVVGPVADYEEEFRRASVTLAPSMFDAGVFLKAIRPMAMGCPVVLNPASAIPIQGLENGVHALVGHRPAEFAECVVQAMRNPDDARRLGSAAKDLVQQHYSWQRAADRYLSVFNRTL
ncbi:glycosyltransferase family 4 protein [Mycobacterium sp. NBC_00419]|uniref:glycosyltransferase family 4 protein n=1 Tax=Mycobacterium sp. NBC_00419 TaxID=2975989 RepID=UPI002E20AA70